MYIVSTYIQYDVFCFRMNNMPHNKYNKITDVIVYNNYCYYYYYFFAIAALNAGISNDWGNTFTDKCNFGLLLHEGIRNTSHARIFVLYKNIA